MTIEKIACARLNGNSECPSRTIREVFVKFHEISSIHDISLNEYEPIAVMCDLYDPASKKCSVMSNENCLYSEWKNFK